MGSGLKAKYSSPFSPHTVTSSKYTLAIPAWTQYRDGSATAGTLAPGIVGITIEFSDDGGANWGYGPVSGAGGAPAGFDANVTNVRWVFNGTLAGGDGTADGVGFIVRIIAE